jgi:hypothetical protein
VFRELSVAEQRYQAVLAVIEDGLQVTEAAARGVTRQALHSWLCRYGSSVAAAYSCSPHSAGSVS